MYAKVNDSIRQKLMVDMVENCDNIYLVFSKDEDRLTGADVSDNSRATLASVFDNPNITMVYAAKLNDLLHYAIKNSLFTGEVAGTEEILFNNILYKITEDMTGREDELWNCLYANAPMPLPSAEEYNVVSVILDFEINDTLQTDDIIDTFEATSIDGKIIMQSRPAMKNLQNEENQFPLLISF
jgi:hypothetical protein